uniref:C1q and TNF related 2 n=1 Tax=Cynoglossus semilaevis TaxID=244447 RepID=A0A3P8WFH0_CYNSE
MSAVVTLSINSTTKKGRNITIHSSQMVCSLPGPAGPAGNPGFPGPPGAVGSMGIPGKDGPDGKDGEKGEKGDRGGIVNFLTLWSGDPGRTGNQGKPGVKGREGVIGKAGPRGLKGLRGSPGISGKRGPKGQNGEFVCVIPGVYYFTYDITVANKHLAIGLLHNGQYKIKTFDANTGNHDVASGSTVLHLQKDDQVWLQIFYSEQNGLFFDPFWTDSTFTGFLIYETSPVRVRLWPLVGEHSGRC